ncbi:hypothetical protein VSS74_15595 [Conexibacter stalactiti]|uniref:Collagen-like protein n=1 Tax=Conexibacter stalactiti TaxID=1940611 RepID=A0ABU4HR50_9ACTN|nr:hypothetical protein [Conexibacter stalactiti]MDW5595773.1 hypothetical protein [Conexibacter stalactiti]MEC5036415.1 hypothetical protein [Conexibacter stalactiti]
MADVYYQDTPVRVIVDDVAQTLDDSYLASVIVDQVGVENLVGPAGPQGETGPQGEQGPTGPAGSDATLADGSVTAAKLAAGLKPTGTATDATEAVRRLGSGAGEAVPGINGVGRVAHGAATDVSRPTGYALVIWIGSGDPASKATGDLWIRTPAA